MITHEATIVLSQLDQLPVESLPAWEALLQILEENPKPFQLLSTLSRLEHHLIALGVSLALIEAIKIGIREDKWEEAVFRFGESRNAFYNFYLGPMRAAENKPVETGMFLIRKCGIADRQLDLVRRNSTEIGFRLFGFPCEYLGHEPEFYDFILATGALARNDGRHISFFSPFYFAGWKSVDRQAAVRRVILFQNLIVARFRSLTLPIAAAHLRFNGSAPLFLNADEDSILSAFALLLSLHELIHASGPLPLFQSSVRKLPLGLKYAGIEELRVDMTVWLILETCRDLFDAKLVELAQQILIAERLLRSARAGLRKNPDSGFILKSSDGEQGALWFAALLEGGGLKFDSENRLEVSSPEVADVIRTYLDAIYTTETSVAEDLNNGQQRLLEFADNLRQRLFGQPHGKLSYPAVVLAFMQKLEDYPDRLHCRFG